MQALKLIEVRRRDRLAQLQPAEVPARSELRAGHGAGGRTKSNGNLQFQYPWVLALLALLPVYAFLRGRVGKLAALRFSSADIARAAGAAARAAAGRLLLFLRLLTVALCIVALAGPRFANDHTETQASGVDIMLVLDLSWSMMALDMGAAAGTSLAVRHRVAGAGGFHPQTAQRPAGPDRLLGGALPGQPADAQP